MHSSYRKDGNCIIHFGRVKSVVVFLRTITVSLYTLAVAFLCTKIPYFIRFNASACICNVFLFEWYHVNQSCS